MPGAALVEGLADIRPDLGIAFDTANPTGGDDDLRTPGFGVNNSVGYGNVLIIAENDFDWNGDGLIDSADLGIWQQNYDPLGVLGGIPVEVVPEPGTLSLLGLVGLGGLTLIRRRRRGRLDGLPRSRWGTFSSPEAPGDGGPDMVW